jgi:antitoxin PrlF
LTEVINLKIAQNGRVILPLKVRKALGVNGEGVVLLSLDGDSVKLSSIRESILRAQKLYRDNVKVHETTEDFLKDRRAETAREEAEDGATPQWQE